MDERLAITTSGDRPIADISEDLAQAGFAADEILGEINVIIGRADATVVRDLKLVEGVTDVAPDLPIDLGPPDQSDTW